ncbi:MAG: hypothetical protein AB1420_11020 [Bacillota bacterium]
MKYIMQHPDKVMALTIDHIQITLIAVLASVIIGQVGRLNFKRQCWR